MANQPLIVTDLFEVRVLDKVTGKYHSMWRCYAKHPDGTHLEDYFVQFDAPTAAEAVQKVTEYYD